MKKLSIRVVRLAVVTYILALIMLMLLERSMVYPAPPRDAGSWDVNQFGAEDVSFVSADGTKLHGWYFQHPEPKAAILFCHGNGEHIGFLGESMYALSQRLSASVFVFDYRGYGLSEGKPFERGVLEDGEAAQRWLAKRSGLQANEIVIYGRSLGGGVAVHLASSLGARTLVIERTFHSMVDIGADQFPWLPVRLVMKNRFPSEEKVKGYSGPLLQLHGDADALVPLESARRLFDACPSDQKTFVKISGMGHNDATPKKFIDAVAEALH